jgi:hypothetical protein
MFRLFVPIFLLFYKIPSIHGGIVSAGGYGDMDKLYQNLTSNEAYFNSCSQHSE